jgi:hypothetical protein
MVSEEPERGRSMELGRAEQGRWSTMVSEEPERGRSMERGGVDLRDEVVGRL